MPSTGWLAEFGQFEKPRKKKKSVPRLEVMSWLLSSSKSSQRIKSKHYFDFAKIWPNNELPWIRMVLAKGTKSELQEIFYSEYTKTQKNKSEKLRNSLSREMIGDWLRKQNFMLARPLLYTKYDDARIEIFRLHLNPTVKEKAYGIFLWAQFLLSPISFIFIIFLFTVLYSPMGFQMDSLVLYQL